MNTMHSPSDRTAILGLTTVALLHAWADHACAQRLDESAAPPALEVDDAEVGAEAEEAIEDDSGDATEEADPSYAISDITVAGVVEQAFEAGGSVHVVSEATLEELNYDDPLSVLARVPGVNVRQEEGFGLRPNIGLRGASSERSRKITLMEDGILLAPAPYSAPAAYYFPLMTRMTGLEVALGPAAIVYGPHTVGGAVNLIGRPIPSRREGRIDLALGTTWLGRLHAHYGDSNRWGGFVVEAVHLRSDGFRTLDWAQHDSGTGFDRTDILARGDLHGELAPGIFHRLEATFGLGLEGSNETYVGLTDADFRADPLRRYGATSTDRMEWWRTRAQLRYELEIGDDIDLRLTAYRHDFSRTWQRLESFSDGTSFQSVLSNPTGRNRVYYESLLGDETGTSSVSLLRVRNQRAFVSQGVQLDGRFRAETGPIRHDVTAGLRLHTDEVDRVHSGQDLRIEHFALVPTTPDARTLETNRASAVAFAAWLAWQVDWQRLRVTPGVRLEVIHGEHVDRATGVRVNTEQAALLPGLGLQYELLDRVAAFAGVHMGFSPTAPGQAAEVRPEQSVNWELGARVGRADDDSNGQLAFFVSDYENLTGDCSGAGGCAMTDLDRQFNAGDVLVLGVEAQAAHVFVLDEVRIPVRGTYTWTHSRFASSFVSDNPQWGSVAAGDALPYVPEHQGTVQAGIAYRAFRVDLTGAFASAMRDRAGRGPGVPTDWTDAIANLDAVVRLEIWPGFTTYVRGENLTNQLPIVSRRPFGARGSRPFMVQLGVELDLD